MELKAGSDFRRREFRREVFLRFYEHQLEYRSHPGGVYYALPHMAREMDWDTEQREWAAFIQGNTQNPVTTLLLMQAAPNPKCAGSAVEFWKRYYKDLQWDTDRRYHKARFGEAVDWYVEHGPWDIYRPVAPDWRECWEGALKIPYMGRLSAWSYLEYRRLLVPGVPDADTLMLGDRNGSRSHRNGLALVAGLDEMIWWDTNPGFDGRYTPDMVQQLEQEGQSLIQETRVRYFGSSRVAAHLGYLTLESALCTYKGWHRANRRYPGVYNDLLYDRLIAAENRFGYRFGLLWDARRAHLPKRMRLEDNPRDPGCVPVKQNHYLKTGEVLGMTHDHPCFANGFDAAVARGDFGERKRRWI